MVSSQRAKANRKSTEFFSDNPIVNVLSRNLAWEQILRARGADELGGLTTYIRRVRYELGMTIRSKADDERWRKKNLAAINLQTDNKSQQKPNWKFLYLPSHLAVRNLAFKPIIEKLDPKAGVKLVTFEIVFFDPAIPALRIYVGAGDPPNGVDYVSKRAVYMLLHDEKNKRTNSERLYIGRADDAGGRMEQHLRSKKPHYYFLAFPRETAPQFNGDVRDATEALMISFWSEIARVSNDTLGTTVEPMSKADFQASILLTSAVSAAYIYTIRELATTINEELALDVKPAKPVQIPFLVPKERLSEWPECYLESDPTPKIDEGAQVRINSEKQS